MEKYVDGSDGRRYQFYASTMHIHTQEHACVPVMKSGQSRERNNGDERNQNTYVCAQDCQRTNLTNNLIL